MPENEEITQSLAEYKTERFAPPAAEKTEPAVEVEPEAEQEEAEPKEEKPKKGKLAERFSELTQARNAERTAREAADARAVAAEARLAELESRNKPAKTAAEDAEPQPKDYTDAYDYARDLSRWEVKQALKDRDAQDAKAKEEEQRGSVLKAWQARLDAAKNEDPEFEEAVATSNLSVSDVVRDTIIESEFGPRILKHLALDDEAADELNAMTVKQAMKHIGRLEAKFEAAAESKAEPKEEKPRIKLPDPIRPIKSVASNTGTSALFDAKGEFTGTPSQWKTLRLQGKV